MIATIGTDPVSGVGALHLRLARPARGHQADHRHGRPVRGHRADRAGRASPTGRSCAAPRRGAPADRATGEADLAAAGDRLRRSAPSRASTPGGGGTIAAFISYNEAKRWSKHPEEFGRGSVEGVAAPECANNVVTGTALIPLLSLGIPGSNSAAVLLGGFLIHGLMPGPMLFERDPEVLYGLYAGLFVANLAMLLDRRGHPHAVPLAREPAQAYLMAFIFALVVSGVYAIEQSLFDLGIVLAAGVLGYGMRSSACRCCRWCSASCSAT